jgi:hypothetical protein
VAAAGVTTSCLSVDLTSPTVTMQKFYNATKRKDLKEFRRTLSRQINQHIDEVAKNSDPWNQPEALVAYSAQYLSLEMPELRNEKISSDKASVEVDTLYRNYLGQKHWDTVNFVKEGGGWKIDDPLVLSAGKPLNKGGG